eukprot:Sspe_Gene.9025::Locus_3038_Transcript_1_1_Confidence_1.000_Length_1263::g.9025::m.9025
MPLGKTSASPNGTTPRRGRLAKGPFDSSGASGALVPRNPSPRPSEPSTRGGSPIRQRALSGHRPPVESSLVPYSSGRHPTYKLVPVDPTEEPELEPYPSAYTRATAGHADFLWEYQDQEKKWVQFRESADRLEAAYLAGANTIQLPIEGSKAKSPPMATFDLKEMTQNHPKFGSGKIRRREMAMEFRYRPKSFNDYSVQFVRRHNPRFDLTHEGFFGGTFEKMKIEGCEANCAEVVSTGHVWTGEKDGTLRIWNAKTGQRMRTTEQKKDIYCMSLLEVPGSNPNNTTVWAGFTDSVIRVFNAQHPYEVLLQLKRHAQGTLIYCLVPQIGGHCVFSGGQDGQIYQWDVRTYECIGQFSGHRNAVRCMIADADVLYSGSDDGTIAVWDIYGR